METSKVGELVRSDLEGFKRQQENVNEKITDMI
jgi:hypothetical protein